MNYRLRFMETRCFISRCDLGARRVDFVELQQLANIYNKDLSFFAIEYGAARPAGFLPLAQPIRLRLSGLWFAKT
jgi:hypothetical protein